MTMSPEKAREIAIKALKDYESKYPDEPSPEPDNAVTLEEFCERCGDSPSEAKLNAKIIRAQSKVASQLSYEEFSKSPLYQARAKKNPNYWKNIGGMGGYNVPVMNAVAEIITEQEQLKEEGLDK